MPFGLRNAAQSFQRYMDSIHRDLDFVYCYIDDIILMSNNLNEHEQHLKIVFECLKVNYYINKYVFDQPEITYLGFRINKDGCRPPEERVETITNIKKPETIVQLRRFLGILNFYRRCIPKAAHLQAPLNRYLVNSRKNDKTQILWTPEAEISFENCKRSLAEATLLAHPEPTAPMTLVTDASDVAIGGVVQQKQGDVWKPLSFFSRKLSSAESKYSAYDRELLAIYASIKYFKHLLEGREFIVKTDHKPLVYAFAQKPEKASPRQLRHLDFISQFSTEIQYVKGENNTVADALSRVEAISMPITCEPEELQT